jgi:membrane dipeptidase
MEKIKQADFHIDAFESDPRVKEIKRKAEAIDVSRQLTPESIRQVDMLFASIWDEWKKHKNSESQKEVINAIVSLYESTKYFNIVRDDKNEKGVIGPDVILHLEGCDAIRNQKDLDYLFNRGIKSLGLLYNSDNLIGGGAFGDKGQGLTDFGKEIIKSATSRGMIIDLAHANDKTTREAIELMLKIKENCSIVYSHGALNTEEVNPKYREDLGERLITIERSLEIAKSGGLIGLTPATPFFTTVQKIVDQIKRFSDKKGDVLNLAIGSDLGGFPNNMAIKGLETLDRIQAIGSVLADNNFSDEEIKRILGENLIEYVNKILKKT